MENNFTPNAYPEEISERLQKLTHQPEETREEMSEALYDLLAICENEYNDEKYRTLYKSLSVLANGFFEVSATYYKTGYEGRTRRLFYRGETPEQAIERYNQDAQYHDLAKYTPTTIESVTFIPLE